MTYIRLALSLIRLITLLLERRQRSEWMNEGARRLIAQQIKEANDALAKAAGVEQEVRNLTQDELVRKMEEKGWLTD